MTAPDGERVEGVIAPRLLVKRIEDILTERLADIDAFDRDDAIRNDVIDAVSAWLRVCAASLMAYDGGTRGPVGAVAASTIAGGLIGLAEALDTEKGG